MSIADRAAAMHARSYLRLHGRTVTYRRAGGSSATLTMARGQHEREETDRRGVVVVVRDDDWLVRPCDFRTAFGSTAEPADNDEVVYGGRVYRVMPMGGDACWRQTDHNGQLWRIHTKDYKADV